MMLNYDQWTFFDSQISYDDMKCALLLEAYMVPIFIDVFRFSIKNLSQLNRIFESSKNKLNRFLFWSDMVWSIPMIDGTCEW